MNDDTDLPDEDIELARRIGDGLEKGTVSRTEPRDIFLEALLVYRSEGERISSESSHQMWERIDESTRPARADRPPLRQAVRHRWVWASAAVAAVILIVVLTRPDATLVARAGADAVEYIAADGSVVTLRPNSELYEIADSRYRIEGEAFFVVTKRERDRFVVEAGQAQVEVLGTRFNLSTWGGETAVYLEEGRIRFKAQGRDVVLEPGQWSRVSVGGEIMEPRADTPDEHLDWLRGEMQFEQRAVRLLAAELEQHFGIHLTIPASMQDETLTGRILLDGKEQSLEDLGRAMGGSFVEVRRNFYRFEPQ
jgi:transmembrane sensor